MTTEVAAKPRILLVGGDERTITADLANKCEVFHDPRVGPKLTVPAGDFAAVVVVSKFVSHSKAQAARRLAAVRGTPLVFARGPNYVVSELERRGLLKPDPAAAPPVEDGKDEAWKDQPWAKPFDPEAAAAGMFPQGGVPVDVGDVVMVAGAMAEKKAREIPQDAEVVTSQDDHVWGSIAAAVRAWFGKDRPIARDKALAAIGEAVEALGMPTGVQRPTAEEVLARAIKEGVLFERPGETEPKYSANPIKHAQFAVDAAVNVGGVRPGANYGSLSEICDLLKKYVEFRTVRGEEYSSSWYKMVLSAALDMGVITAGPKGGFVIVGDEDIQLTAWEAGGKSVEKKRGEEPQDPDSVTCCVSLTRTAWDRMAASSLAAAFGVTVDAALKMRVAGVVDGKVWEDHATREVRKRVEEMAQQEAEE